MKRLFTDDSFFLLSTIVSSFGSVIYMLVKTFASSTGLFLNYYLLLSTICVIALYASYKKHSKNIMKGMMGSLLMAQLICAIDCFNNIETNFDKTFAPIYMVLMALMFINHYVINASHKASPKAILLNQVLALLLAITNTLWCICWIKEAATIIDAFSEIAGTLSYIGYICCLVCVESRLDAYRQIRDENK